MIRVNDDWVIMVDRYSYAPMRDMHRDRTITRKDGTTETMHDFRGEYGYFTTLKGALKGIAQLEYKNALSGSETALPDAIKLMDEILTRFEKRLKEIRE